MVIKSIFVVVFSMIFVRNVTSDISENYMVKLTGLDCKDINKTLVTNVTCYLKAVRGKLGVAFIGFTFKNIPEISVCYKLYYRNSGGRYLPYILNYCWDICQFMSIRKGGNPLIDGFLKAYSAYSSGFFDGCPLNAEIHVFNYEFDKDTTKYLPPIIPAGDFKFNARHYTTNTNKTIININVLSNVKAKLGLDLSMLNMG